MKRWLLPCLLALVPLASLQAQQQLELRPGDRIALLGNYLPETMQHHGWLETLLYARFPRHDLVVRNLGFSGDELTIRNRSDGFGSPDDWLNRVQASVVFAFFGFNESFAGPDGLAKFRKDLENFVQHTTGKQYDGKAPPRLVLFSPLAHEDLKNPDLPDGKKNNADLEKYTQVMREVAAARQVPFVDLFHPSLKAYAAAKQPWTFNGVHLNEFGDAQAARIIMGQLFGQEQFPPAENLAQLRAAILDRNFFWFHRYRTTDGYSIYGGRSHLKFVGGQTNRVVMQREMEILDAMTALRDQRVWAVAQGKDLKVDDGKTLPFLEVISNKKGPLPGGKHVFLSGEEAIAKMKVGKGMKVSLFADEKMFPQLINPVQMAFDTRGRLFVATWPTYPHWKPKTEMNDQLLILEDTDGDGKADRCKVFADGLHNPTGFEFHSGGVLVAMAPYLVFLKDTDGDDVADVRIKVLAGIDSADTHHTANSFILDPGGALYFQEGVFHRTQVETPYGPRRNINACVWRFEPRTFKFERYIAHGFANPHGHIFDRWGNDFVVDGTGAVPFHGSLFSGDLDFPRMHPRPPTLYKQRTRPCPGIEILTSKHFPEEFQGNLLVGNVIGFQGILRYRIADKGASFYGTELEPILSSTDPNFRPADFEIGPDGAIWFTDWQNPIIGHMQHNLRDPSRDQSHGRVYRVTYEGRPLDKPAAIAGEPIEKLLDRLKDPEDRVRYRARIELSARNTAEVVKAARAWAAKLDAKDPEVEHHLMEALWVQQFHNVVDQDLLRRLLRSPEFRARAAATRVLCYQRDRVREPLDLLRTQINDPHPRVRLEAIRALSFFDSEEALAVAVEMLAHPDDPYLKYTFNETLTTLEGRLGTGKLDRQNIAVSLVKMLEKGKVPVQRQPALIETVCRHGGAKELQVVWNRATGTEGYPPALKRQVLEWLTEAAQTRRVQPTVGDADVAALLKSPGPEAIRLVAAWKRKDAAGRLRDLAQDAKRSEAVRTAAIEAAASLGDADSLPVLRRLGGQGQPVPIRVQAAVALAQLDLKAAADLAPGILENAAAGDDLVPLVQSFLERKAGPDALAQSLMKNKVGADGAKRVLRAMFLAGRNEPALAAAASKLAGLDISPKPPTPAEIKQLSQDTLAKGDALRGEHVFRRADLGCIKCHAVNKAGGNIGPDLGPIGGSSPVDYILASILDPSQSIKEEYLTRVVATASGKVLTGIVVQRDKNLLVLKDATGKLIRVPTADIEVEGEGKSLMPEGVTRLLTREELLDLTRFVSELGKPGSPLKVGEAPTIRRWKLLREVPASLKEGIPNRDILRDTILAAPAGAWDIVYGLVDGRLPADELPPAFRKDAAWLQGEFQVTRGGLVEFKVEAPRGTAFWIDEEPFENQERAALNLTPGRHRFTVRFPAGSTPAPLKVEVTRPANSRALVELLQGAE